MSNKIPFRSAAHRHASLALFKGWPTADEGWRSMADEMHVDEARIREVADLIQSGTEAPGLIGHLVADATLTHFLDSFFAMCPELYEGRSDFLKRLTMLEAVNAPERLLEDLSPESQAMVNRGLEQAMRGELTDGPDLTEDEEE